MEVWDLLDDVMVRVGRPSGAEADALSADLLLNYLTNPYRKAYELCTKFAEYPEVRKFYITTVNDQEFYDIPLDVGQILHVRKVDQDEPVPIQPRKSQERDYRGSNKTEWYPDYNYHRIGFEPTPTEDAYERYELTYAPVAGRLVVFGEYPYTASEKTSSRYYSQSPYANIASNLTETTVNGSPYAWMGGSIIWSGYPCFKWWVLGTYTAEASGSTDIAVSNSSDLWSRGDHAFKIKLGAQTDGGYHGAHFYLGDNSNNPLNATHGIDFSNITDNSIFVVHFHISNVDRIRSDIPTSNNFTLVLSDGTNAAQEEILFKDIRLGDNYYVMPYKNFSQGVTPLNTSAVTRINFGCSNIGKGNAMSFALTYLDFFDSAQGVSTDVATNLVGSNRPVEELAPPLDLAYEAIVCEACQKVMMAERNIDMATYYRSEAEREWDAFTKSISQSRVRGGIRTIRHYEKSL